jgi:hypothetical protein
LITLEEETYFLDYALVPEHVVSLMSILSDGEPFLVSGYLCFRKEEWLIFVGHALAGITGEDMAAALETALGRFHPRSLWCIGERVVEPNGYSCVERERDEYFRLDLRPEGTSDETRGEIRGREWEVPPRLRRHIRRASERMVVKREHGLSSAHQRMIQDFVERKRPVPRVAALYKRLPEYVRLSPTAVVLDAVDRHSGLTAFSVLEMAAPEFSVFLTGAHSRSTYTPHASDLLFSEMIALSLERGKRYIHLGLGVSEGIRRFKEKWGGRPFLPYEFCAFTRQSSPTSRFLRALGGRS